MSDTTKEINKVTGTIIRVSWKLIIYALAILMLYEGITRGYAFGHDIFITAIEKIKTHTQKRNVRNGLALPELLMIIHSSQILETICITPEADHETTLLYNVTYLSH